VAAAQVEEVLLRIPEVFRSDEFLSWTISVSIACPSQAELAEGSFLFSFHKTVPQPDRISLEGLIIRLNREILQNRPSLKAKPIPSPVPLTRNVNN